MTVGSEKRPGLLFYLCGLLTSAVALVLVFLLIKLFDFSIVNLYVIIVIPAGAILAGVAAGSGYYLVSRFRNIKVSKKMMLAAFVIALVVYAFAYYATFVAATGETSPVFFLQYVQDLAENSSLTIGKSSRTTIENLGGFGYVFLILEFLGFAIGSVGPLLLLSDKAYCKACQTYMKSKSKHTHMPPLDGPDVNQSLGREERRAAIEANNLRLKEEFEKIRPLLQGRSLADNEKTLSGLQQAPQHRNFFYVTYEILGCPTCDKHQITATLNSMAAKDFSSTTEVLGKIDN
jgi:hypothetical protein